MRLRTLGNEPHPDENYISLGCQRANISGVCLEPSSQPQRVAGLDPRCRLVYQPGIQ